jgi:uncharacterized protein YecE (DUF72 family)
MLYIGTSGYSYQDWVGRYYPPALKKSQFLEFYAREFAAVEVNYTYYRLPSARTLEHMAAKTPPEFKFTVKASRQLTHEREENSAEFSEFVAALQPLIDRGKLGCILAQFPHSFHPTIPSSEYLKLLRERMADLPVVVEFRNARWHHPRVYEFLRENDLGFCCVDEPKLWGLLPPVAELTSDIGYARFHGRNAAKWWKHDEPHERYDYTYSDDELVEWVPKIRKLLVNASDVFVFCNNHWESQAIATARQLRLLLDNG